MAIKMGMELEVTSAVIATLIGEARRDAGQECCGLLLGPPVAGARPRITQTVPTANVHREPERHFEIDPVALIAAYRTERNGGATLLGFYHSHHNGHPRPSASDCDHAGGDGRVWAIIAADDVLFWRDEPQGFVEAAVAIVTA